MQWLPLYTYHYLNFYTQFNRCTMWSLTWPLLDNQNYQWYKASKLWIIMNIDDLHWMQMNCSEYGWNSKLWQLANEYGWFIICSMGI